MHSRPYVSNDNQYSESQCCTLKYRPEFRIVSDAFKIAVLSVRDFFVDTTKTIVIPAWVCSRGRWCTAAKQKASCSYVKACSMLISFTGNASYEALRSHPNFPAKSGSTSRFHEGLF